MRTKGAKDLKKRKQRKFYKGKPIKKKRKKNGKYVPYKSNRGRDDPIKIYFFKQEPMSREGYDRWANKFKRKVRKIVYKPYLRVDIPPEDISTKEKVEQVCIDIIGTDGTFHMRGFSKGKNKWGVKQVTLAVIKIRDTSKGLVAKMTENRRLFRYWYWRGD